MTINELINGVNYEIQGPVEVRRPTGSGFDLNKLFACDDGFSDLPENIADMEIAYIYSEVWGNGEAAIIIEAEQDETQ